eukprot:8959799-Ditylum_brightwellii.AAC.1
MLEHVQFSCGSLLIDPDAPIEMAWQREMMVNGVPVLYVKNGLHCTDLIETLVYLTEKLGVSCNICCWCMVEVDVDNGMNELTQYRELHINQA